MKPMKCAFNQFELQTQIDYIWSGEFQRIGQKFDFQCLTQLVIIFLLLLLSWEMYLVIVSLQFIFLYIQKKIESRVSKRDLHPRTQKHYSPQPEDRPTQMSIDRQMDKQTVVCTYNEQYSAFKTQEILTHATIWKKLRPIC